MPNLLCCFLTARTPYVSTMKCIILAILAISLRLRFQSLDALGSFVNILRTSPYFFFLPLDFLSVCDRGHPFSTHAQISRFQTHPPNLYAQYMTSYDNNTLVHTCIRPALDVPTTLRCVRAKLITPYLVNSDRYHCTCRPLTCGNTGG